MVERGWNGKHIIALAGRNEQNVNKKDAQMVTDKQLVTELNETVNRLGVTIDTLKDEIAVQRNAAGIESAARLNEVERLLDLVKAGETELMRSNLKHQGFREAVQLIISRRSGCDDC